MPDPRLVLVFDDAVTEDYEETWPVLREAGVPACFAVPTARIGDDGHLDADQLADLAGAGCEIAAHGREHRYLQAHRLAADAAAGDRRVRVAAGHVFPDEPGGVLVGDRYEVTDGDDSEVREVTGVEAGSEDGNEPPSLELAAPLQNDYDTAETVVRPAESTVEDEVAGARSDLEAIGFDPRTFVLPYDAADPRAWAAVEEHYDVLANAATRSLPNPPGTPPTNLRRYYVETDHLTPVEIAAYLDAVVELDALGVLAGHGAWDTLPPERVARVVEMADERGIEVTTFAAVFGGEE